MDYSEQQIRAMMKDEIQKSNNSGRFNINPNQQLRQNPLNTSSTPTSVLTYVGLVLINGSTNPPSAGAAGGVFPSGWTIDHGSTGDYLITHNLGTGAYAVVASPIGTTTAVEIESNDNQVEFTWFDTFSKAATSTPFFFILTVVNNRRTSFPTYTQI